MDSDVPTTAQGHLKAIKRERDRLTETDSQRQKERGIKKKMIEIRR